MIFYMEHINYRLQQYLMITSTMIMTLLLRNHMVQVVLGLQLPQEMTTHVELVSPIMLTSVVGHNFLMHNYTAMT